MVAIPLLSTSTLVQSSIERENNIEIPIENLSNDEDSTSEQDQEADMEMLMEDDDEDEEEGSSSHPRMTILEESGEMGDCSEILKLEIPSSSVVTSLSCDKCAQQQISSSSSSTASSSATLSLVANKIRKLMGILGSSTSTRTVYKDVVVIGNGPSGIALSYLLAGNWPYYNGCGESVNEMLHYRLLAAAQENGNNKKGDENKKQSIVEQDLRFLAQGLEGRSSNPVALLFDTLNHPEADLGLELPSLLDWQKNKKHAIDHVVIGKGPPGGAWQMMDGNVLTISLGCWMELPQMNFREWEASRMARMGIRGESRASVASVAQYYCDYVQAHELDKYFTSHSEITSVTHIPSSAFAGLPQICDNLPEDVIEEAEEHQGKKIRRHTISEIPVSSQNGRELKKRNRALFHVQGFTRDPRDLGRRKEFSYLTKNLVLATGSSDSPNILNVPGEHLDYVLHSLKHLEQLIASGQLNQDSDPILVVGAGLSAADAIIAARFHSIPVIHVFRRSVDDRNLIFKQLPENMYPEYHKVYQMMQDPNSYDGYKVYEQHVVADINPNRRVKLMGSLSCGIARVSYIVICIGSHPDLSFLGGIERNLGVQPGLPIDCKRNPIAIDFSTHESVRQPGLFALGPLVGENFVRFLQGGALAITNYLTKSKNSSC